MTVIPLFSEPGESKAWAEVFDRAASTRPPELEPRFARVSPTHMLDGVKRCDGCGTWVVDVDRCETCR